MTKKKEVEVAAVAVKKAVKEVDPVEALAEKIYIEKVNLNSSIDVMKDCARLARVAAGVFCGE